jgi:hypothetical protein
MTVESAIELAKSRMNDLGQEGNYYLRLRHFVLAAQEERTEQAYNQVWILVDESPVVHVSCLTGVFDLSIDYSAELNYEFSGEVKMKNYSITATHLRFVQVIIKHEKQKVN